MRTEARFWAKVDRWDPDECWLWTGGQDGWGYGTASSPGPGGSRRAHRIAYELVVGPIPAGLQLDHLCRNRACVNPKHLEPVTQKENIRRGAGLAAQNAVKTHCPKGHPYDEANTYLGPGSGKHKGLQRKCRQCGREWDKAGYHRRASDTREKK